MVVGGSSQSKRFVSSPGPIGDHVRAAIVDRPLKHIQVTIPGCTSACVLIPGAALAPEPLQYLQVTTLCCTFACAFIPRAALTPKPLQYLQVTMLSCTPACFFIPRAALAPEPIHCLQMAAYAGIVKEYRIQLEPLLSFQPMQGLQLASARCEEEKEVRSRNKAEEDDEDSPA